MLRSAILEKNRCFTYLFLRPGLCIDVFLLNRLFTLCNALSAIAALYGRFCFA